MRFSLPARPVFGATLGAIFLASALALVGCTSAREATTTGSSASQAQLFGSATSSSVPAPSTPVAPTSVAAPVTTHASSHPARSSAPAPPRTTAPAATHPATTHPAAPPPSPARTTSRVSAPSTTSAPAGCYPLTNGGKCYEPGEFCRESDHGMVGLAGDGKTIKCEDNNGWRWEPI